MALNFPKIMVISYKGLSRLTETLIPEYQDRAEIQLVDVLLNKALEQARAAENAKSADVIVTAGANAAFLRSSLQIPVVEIKASGYDLMLALMKARTISERVGVVTYKETVPELNAIKTLLSIEIEQRTYLTIEDGHNCFHSLAAEGIKVIVGSSLVVELAIENNLQGILTYSPSSIKQAFDYAIDLALLARLKSSRFEQLNSVVENLREAVLAVDTSQRITAMNPAMEKLLLIPAHDCIGNKLNTVAPDLTLGEVLDSGAAEIGTVIHIHGTACVANITAIREGMAVTGAVITLQDAQRIQLAESKLRTQRRHKSLSARYHFDQIVGKAPAFAHVKQVAMRYANTHSTVLLTGESGTGKELFAQAIHNASPRKSGPFVAINCASLPEPLLESELFGYEEGAFTGTRKGGKIGLFESAHHGTIFLDEIGDMPLTLQTRLLRVLQEKEVTRLGSTQPIPIDVRVIAATHHKLSELITHGSFRSDLYYRLHILSLNLPPLRDRQSDIPALATLCLSQSLQRLGSRLPAKAAIQSIVSRLQLYKWPGNVRELENVMERLAVFLADLDNPHAINYSQLSGEFPEILESPDHLPDISGNAVVIQDEITYPAVKQQVSKMPMSQELIQQALRESAGHQAEAAKRLGISRTTLWRKLKEFNDETALENR
jgi:propionate catabolism operon transcriptional regulator